MKKFLLRVLFTVILLLLLMAVDTAFAAEAHAESYQNDIKWTQEIEVTDGEASPGNVLQDNLQFEKDGTYIFYVECVPNQEGLVTGCVLYDEKGNVRFFCSGDTFTVESRELELEAGIYTIEMVFLSNHEDFKKFIDTCSKKMVMSEEDAAINEEAIENPYDYKENGTFQVEVNYRFQEEGTRSIYYTLGLVFGVICGLLFVALFTWIIRKCGGKFGNEGKLGWKNLDKNYDERQLLARGEGYRAGFLTLIIYLCVVSVLSEAFGIHLFMSFAGLWIGVCLSIFTFAVICIMKDAYMSLVENAKGVIMMFSAIAILNLVIGLTADMSQFVVNGVIATNCINLIVGVLLLAIVVVFSGRMLYINKKYDEEEDE